MTSKLAVARAYLAARHPRRMERDLGDAPVVGEDCYLTDFAKYNVLGVSLEEARQRARAELASGKPSQGEYSFGLSTGTTGEPGVFLTSPAERDRWLGTILGKFLSPCQVLRMRAALLLKNDNRLYHGSGRVHYVDIGQPLKQWAAGLCKLAPNILIGPPGILLALGESETFRRHPFRPEVVLSAAEVLYPQDRKRLQAIYGAAPRNLYQAKEGFLAAGCAHGALHWNEDLMVLEGYRFLADRERVVPVISDFTRQSQTYRRYRLDDVIRVPAAAPCPCPTPLQKIAAVEGRLQDVLLIPDGSGHRPVFAMDANEYLRSAGDYTLTQHDGIYFTLACTYTPSADSLRGLLDLLGEPERFEIVPLRPDAPGRKRRRFRRQFDPENKIILRKLLGPLERLR
ncbi:MAG TPA: hypothetical protein VFQ91_15690 [Bryobacteraceae bacterium]|nr:hypothetical protein [Bryobacteraceae bacterium]